MRFLSSVTVQFTRHFGQLVNPPFEQPIVIMKFSEPFSYLGERSRLVTRLHCPLIANQSALAGFTGAYGSPLCASIYRLGLPLHMATLALAARKMHIIGTGTKATGLETTKVLWVDHMVAPTMSQRMQR
jgi:hypothetical protein